MNNVENNAAGTNVYLSTNNAALFGMNSHNRVFQQKLEVFAGLLEQATSQVETQTVMSPNLLGS